MDMIDDADTIIMSFLDTSEGFSLGFECGQFWMMLVCGITIDYYVAHNKNVAQLTEMAKIFDKAIVVQPLTIDDDMPPDVKIDVNDYVEISFVDVGKLDTTVKTKPTLRVVK